MHFASGICILGRYVVAQVHRLAELVGKFTWAHGEKLVAFLPAILFASAIWWFWIDLERAQL
jgi:hypothetical protein